MKKVLLSSIAYLSLANGPALAEVYDECTESSTATSTLIVDSDDGARTCSVTPSTLTFKLFEVGICSADAAADTTTPMENDTCIAVFTSANGLDANLSKGGSIPLSPELTLDEGTYTHGYILVGTEAKITMSHTFSTVRSASRGQDKEGKALKQNSPSADGVVCYTNGNPIGVDASNSVTCGATNGAQAASSMSQRLGDKNSKFSYMESPMAVAGSASVTTRVWVLNSSKVQASGDYSLNENKDDFGRWDNAVGDDAAAIAQDRPYNYAIQPLSPALVVSPTTSSISIKFNVTNATAFDFWDPTVAEDFSNEGCLSCIQDVAFDGMNFAFTSE